MIECRYDNDTHQFKISADTSSLTTSLAQESWNVIGEIPKALKRFDARQECWWVPGAAWEQVIKPWLVKNPRVNWIGMIQGPEVPKKLPFFLPAGCPLEPLSFQHDGIRHLIWGTGRGLWDDMGLGKTLQSLWAAYHLYRAGRVRRILVLCKKSIKSNWHQEIAFAFNNHPEFTKKIEIAHYEELTSKNGKKFKDLLRFVTCADTVVIVDEFHNFANEFSQRAQCLWELRKASKFFWALSGTIFGNSNRPESVLCQYKLLTGAEINQKQFNWLFYDEGRRQWKNLENLRRLVEPFGLRRLKSEVTDLPPPVNQVRNIELTGRQKELYQQMAEEFLVELKGMDDQEFTLKAKDVRSQMTRLVMIASHPCSVGDGINSKDVSKFMELQEIVSEVIESQKVIVWSRHPAVITEVWNTLTRLLELRAFYGSQVHGRQTEEQNDVALKHFKRDSDCRFLGASIGAFGEGLNLQVASVAIYLDLPWSYPHFKQSRDRIHRIGQERLCSFYYLLAKGTIDEALWETLERKEDFQGFLTSMDRVKMIRLLESFMLSQKRRKK